MQEVPKSKKTPSNRMTGREVSKEGNMFIREIMMMGWRSRPTARELLEDEWSKEKESR